nr:MAG TPA: hypothetical protein [Caudoviricetes sp.]
MKYKVGDKVKVRSDLKCEEYYGGITFTFEMNRFKGMEFTIARVNYGGYYEVLETPYNFTEEMLEPVKEMSAEEAIRIQNEMCRSIMCKDCAIEKLRCDSWCGCTEYCSKNPDKVLEVLKQWKKDHEKKPIETEFIWYLLVVEEKTHIVKYEKPLKIERERTTDEQKEELLREWCSEHDGKYYVTTERRCVVKE